MRHESLKVTEFSPLMLSGFHTADSPLCHLMSGSVPVHAESQGVMRCSWWVCLPRAHSHVSFFCYDCQVPLGEEGPLTASCFCCCGPEIKGAGAGSLQEITFSVGILCLERGLQTDQEGGIQIGSFSWRRRCFKCTKGSGVSVSEAVVCQQYKRYCSCCSPWNKSTCMGITGCDKKRGEIANGKWQNPSYTFSSCKT